MSAAGSISRVGLSLMWLVPNLCLWFDVSVSDSAIESVAVSTAAYDGLLTAIHESKATPVALLNNLFVIIGIPFCECQCSFKSFPTDAIHGL